MYTLLLSSNVEEKLQSLQLQEKKKIKKIFEKLEKNPFDPSLKTHKLSGKLENFWSCSINYKNRVIFLFIENNTIYVTDIGSHDIYK